MSGEGEREREKEVLGGGVRWEGVCRMFIEAGVMMAT